MTQLRWPDDRCVVCLSTGRLTWEHVIPSALGGRLALRFLCKSCNDRLGHQQEAEVRRDPAVRLALEQLRDRIPELAKRLSEGLEFEAESAGGRARGVLRRGSFRPRAVKDEHGSPVLLPTEQARRFLGAEVRRAGGDEAAVDAALSAFDTSPDDQKVFIGPGLEAIRWRVRSLSPSLSGPTVSEAVPVKMAYEYLAGHLGMAAYGPALDSARAILRGEATESVDVDVEHLRGLEYEPFHGLAVERDHGHATVQIRLFGWIAYRVHFRAVGLRGPRLAYRLDLDTGEEHWAEMA